MGNAHNKDTVVKHLLQHGEWLEGSLGRLCFIRGEGRLKIHVLLPKGIQTAVTRNQLKRQLKDACRNRLKKMGHKNAKLAIVPDKRAYGLHYVALEDGIIELLDKAGLCG